MKESVSLIFLAGGHSKRMGYSLPKQYLPLKGRPIFEYSLEVFCNTLEIQQIIVVCEPIYRQRFSFFSSNIEFALPGHRRQDSVFNGLLLARFPWVCIHDSARPFINQTIVQSLIDEGKQVGAATVGVPMKSTVKLTTHQQYVVQTLDRSKLWEIQTPQFLAKKILEDGFEKIKKEDLTVTDDTSIAELLDHPVKLVEGSYFNLKITTPDDLILAENYFNHIYEQAEI